MVPPQDERHLPMSLVFLKQIEQPPTVKPHFAAVVELADARDLKSLGRDTIPVQARSAAPEDPLITGGLHVAALRSLAASVTRVVRRRRFVLARYLVYLRCDGKNPTRHAFHLTSSLFRHSASCAEFLTIPVSGTRRPPDLRGSSCSRVTVSRRVGDASCSAACIRLCQTGIIRTGFSAADFRLNRVIRLANTGGY